MRPDAARRLDRTMCEGNILNFLYTGTCIFPCIIINTFILHVLTCQVLPVFPDVVRLLCNCFFCDASDAAAHNNLRLKQPIETNSGLLTKK